MTYTDVQAVALAVLTSIITGGFVLVFIEIGNRKNRENDRYDAVMQPFMHKLSSYFRFMSWAKSYVKYPSPVEGYVKDFKTLVEEMSRLGGRLITSGGDYPIGYFSAEIMYKITFKINNIWYFYDRMNPCPLSWDPKMRGTETFIDKELQEINPIYLSANKSVALIAKVSGDFYTDIYQPIEAKTYNHEAFQKEYHHQTLFVLGSFFFVLLLLCLMLFIKLPVLLLQLLVSLAILLLVGSILVLAVDTRKQIKWKAKISEYMKTSRYKMKKSEKIVTWLSETIESLLGFFVSSLLVVGLLLSLWAIFSIEIKWIPLVLVNCTETTVAGLNKVFLALAYSYIVGAIIYWFTVRLPYWLNKRRLKTVLDAKIDNIGSQLLNMTIEFRNLENPKITDVDEIMKLFTIERWKQQCRVPIHDGRKNVTEAFVSDYYQLCDMVTSFLTVYKEYLTAQQITLLEQLRSSQILGFFTVAEHTSYVFSDYFYDKVMKPAFRTLLEEYNELVKISQ